MTVGQFPEDSEIGQLDEGLGSRDFFAIAGGGEWLAFYGEEDNARLFFADQFGPIDDRLLRFIDWIGG